MDIQLNDEQTQLQDSLQRLLRDQYPFSTRRQIVASEPGYSRAHWQQFSELGLLAAPFAEAVGGLGGGPVSTLVVMKAFGRSLVVEPYTETVVLAGCLIEAAGSPSQNAAHLAPIMGGQALWALAWAEPRSRYDLGAVETVAVPAGPGYRITGAKAAVVGAKWADRLIVSARTDSQPSSPGELSLFMLDANAPGVSMQHYKTVDGRWASEVTLAQVQVSADDMLGQPGAGLSLLEACRDRAIAASCAEALGAMEALNAATLEYCKTRKQFGVPLGSFQVLQHRMVDMFIALEEATSLTQHLCLQLQDGEAGLSRLASGAKAKVGEAARFIGEQAVQLHGGMGMSDELIVGHHLKRLAALNIQFGDSTHHLMRYAQLAH